MYTISTNTITMANIDIIIQKFKSLCEIDCYFQPCEKETEINFDIKTCSPLCQEIAASEKGSSLCLARRRFIAAKAIVCREPVVTVCHGGICEFAVPVFITGNLYGIFFANYMPSLKSTEDLYYQADLYKKNYDISNKRFCECITGNPSLPAGTITPLVDILNSLILLYLDSRPAYDAGPPYRDHERAEDPEEPMEDDNLRLSELLSAAIQDTASHPDTYAALSNAIDKYVHRIYMELLNGNYKWARRSYGMLLQGAFAEKKLDMIRFNIIYLLVKFIDIFPQCNSVFSFMFQLSSTMFLDINRAKETEKIRAHMDHFYDMLETYAKSAYTDRNPVVERLVRIIDNCYKEQLTLEEVAKRVNISPAYASRLFKDELGVNFKWYLNEVRMNNAFRLLVDTELHICDIAEHVGYSEIRSFYKMFEKHFGTTCTRLRKIYKPGC